MILKYFIFIIIICYAIAFLIIAIPSFIIGFICKPVVIGFNGGFEKYVSVRNWAEKFINTEIINER